jgi:hypothetical protein
MEMLRIKYNGRTIPEDPVTKGEFNRAPLFFYPSQATQSSIALLAISPRNTDSVLI